MPCRNSPGGRSRDFLTRLRIEPLEARLVLATITVTNAGDAPDLVADDGVCAAGFFNDDGDPVLDDPVNCTLNGAISHANFDPGMDTIEFSIPGPISLTIVRPIVFPVIIDGSTSPLGKMELIGPGVEQGVFDAGLYLFGLGSSGSTIRGMVIHGYEKGIVVASNGNTIVGNYIGTNFDGTAAPGNLTAGIHIFVGTGNMIGGDTPADRNVISGNREGIIFFTASASGNIVRGNYIGTNAEGTAALGNSVAGVRIVHSPGNIIGGSEPGQGNVIAGNGLIGNVDEPDGPLGGVVIEGVGSVSNIVTGNLIGTDKTGNVRLGNRSGVWVNGAPTTTITDNVISGSVIRSDFLFGTGVTIVNPLAAGSVVKGNKIGTNLAGDADLGNDSDGVHVQDSGGNFIGGPTAEERNIISGNGGDGVWIGGFDAATPAVSNFIQGNYIGVNAAGTAPLPNDFSGVHISSHTSMTMLGGHSADAGNLISGNGTDGVFLPTGTSNGNMIHSNLIGTDHTGLAAIPNGGSGINIWGGRNNIIGGTDENPNSGNTISANQQHGVYIHEWPASGPFLLSRADGNQLRANTIGIGLDGVTPLGNSADGVRIENAQDNIIGGIGTNPLIGNIISANSSGVMISGETATGNKILGNFIGVDWQGNVSDPVTLLGFPIITLIDDGDVNTIKLGGTLGAEPNQSYTIDVYATDISAGTKLEHGIQGQRWLMSIEKTTDETGFVRFEIIIPHSMGGLLARTYVQSDAYGAKFSSSAASRDLALPMISDLTMFGVPNQGASMIWNAWHNNFVIDNSSRLVLSKVINHAWQKLLADKTINTPSGPIKLSTLQGSTEKERQLNFLRAYTPGIKDLMATYDDWGATPSDNPDTRNRLVLDLNNNQGNKIRFADRVARTMVVYGTNIVTASKVRQLVGELPGFQFLNDEIVPFTDIFANDPEETEVWWQDLEEDENGEDYLGDGTVPIESLEGLFLNGGVADERVELHPFCTTEEANCGVPNIATPTGGTPTQDDHCQKSQTD